MPSKKSIELSEFTLTDLQNELTETMKQYQKMEFDHATKGIDNPLTLREVRRDIARMKTELRRRELEEMSAEDLQNRSKKRTRRAKK